MENCWTLTDQILYDVASLVGLELELLDLALHLLDLRQRDLDVLYRSSNGVHGMKN